jgi:NADH-quinone oxidoreductase subunit A
VAQAEYFFIAIYILLAFLVGSLLYTIVYLLTPKEATSEKTSAYECGFEPFSDARGKFDVKFYLVSILFLLFDLEVSFLFPWAINLVGISLVGFSSMCVFLFVLGVGFIYEWSAGALEWE